MPKSLFGVIVAFFVLILVGFGSWFTVDATERGVLLRNGAVVSTEQPGLHFKIPFFESVAKIPVSTQLIRASSKLGRTSISHVYRGI